MLAVYEEKIKEEEVVKKVRMVLNGSKHDNVDLTYAPTPSRLEFLILFTLLQLKGGPIIG